jgi:hypothetical protein
VSLVTNSCHYHTRGETHGTSLHPKAFGGCRGAGARLDLLPVRRAFGVDDAVVDVGDGRE